MLYVSFFDTRMRLYLNSKNLVILNFNEMSKIVLNIPHANPIFPSENEKLKWENQELLASLLNTWTDWFTDKIFMPIDENKSFVKSIVFPY